MWVKYLEINQFRNYEKECIKPAKGINVFVGENAQGKTNFIESLNLCCVGRSHRTKRDEELIRWGESFARVHVKAEQEDGEHDVAIVLKKADKNKKIIKIWDKQVSKIGELMGHVFGVMFCPEDMQMIKGGPSERRRYIDMLLSQIYPSYFYALQSYVKTLNQRNNLLRQIDMNRSLLPTLEMWDDMLIEKGAVIYSYRKKAIEEINAIASEEQLRISGGHDLLSIQYLSDVEKDEDPEKKYRAKLLKNREDDIRRGFTSAGIHRDDMHIRINQKDAKVYASQGQQRSIVLCLKLAQMEVYRKIKGENPILILDDVMSELDVNRRNELVNRIDQIQTFITCTDMSDLGNARTDQVYQVSEGKIISTAS